MKPLIKFLTQLVTTFTRLKTSTKVLVLAAIILGSVIRYINLFHPGYEFDTVTTQYEWGLNAEKMGLINFWRDYTGFFDYLPGALLILSALQWIAKHFGDSAESFVIALKSMNWFADILFAIGIAYVAKRYGKFSNRSALLYSLFVYIMPALWFVSVVWGQFDTLLVLFVFASVILLYRGVEHKGHIKLFYKDPVFWSGFILALGFWFKLQSALVVPVLILFHLSYRNHVWIQRQASGWVLGSVLLLTVPFIANPLRLVVNALQPFVRGDEVTKGASTIWPLLGLTESGAVKPFTYNGFGLSLSTVGLVIYACMMLYSVVRYLRIDLKKLPNIEKLFAHKLSFLDFTLIMTLSSSLYYMLFTKMHSRYLHMGLLFAFISFAGMTMTKASKKWLFLTVILGLSYFLNQVVVYATVQSVNPIWVKDLYESFNLSLLQFASLVNLLCILGMYFWILRKPEQIG